MDSGRLLLIVVTVIFVVAAIICHLIALATDYWLKSSSSSQTNFLNIGLWVACFDHYSHPHEFPEKQYNDCHYISSSYYATIQDWLKPSWLVSCQALAIIGLILQLVGLVFVVLLFIWIFCSCICCRKNSDCCERFLIYCSPIIFVLAGMFLMMVAMVFADNAFKLQCKDFWVGGDPNTNHLSHSWGFEVAACILSFITAGLLLWLAILTGRRNFPPYNVVGK